MHRLIRSALSLAAVAALAACSKGNNDTPADAGHGCQSFKDCTGNGGRQVCLNSVCVNTCSSTSECQTAANPTDVCEEAVCQKPACGSDSQCGAGNACLAGKCATAPAASQVASCVVTPDPGDVRVDSSIQLKAIPKDSDSAPLHFSAITWAADNGATVAADGTLTAHAAGPITVTATAGSKHCTATVNAYGDVAAGSLRVTVINMHTKEPIAGARVVLCASSGVCGSANDTLADGTYTTASFDAASHDVHVFAKGYNYASYIQTTATDLLVALPPFVAPSLRSGFSTHMCQSVADDPNTGDSTKPQCPSPEGEFLPLQDQGEAVHMAFFGSSVPNSLLDLSVDTLVGPMHPVTLQVGTQSKTLSLPYGLVLGIGTSFFGTNDPRVFAEGGTRALWGIGGNANITKVITVLNPLLAPNATIDIGTLLPPLLGFFGRFEAGAVVGVKAPANAAPGGTPTFTTQPVQLTTPMRLRVDATSPALPQLDGSYMDGVLAVAGAMDYPLGFVPLGLTAGLSAKDGHGGVLDPTCDATSNAAACDTNLIPVKLAPENGGTEGSKIGVALLALNFGGLTPGSSSHVAVSGQVQVFDKVDYTAPGSNAPAYTAPAFMKLPASSSIAVTRSTRNVTVTGDADPGTQIYRFELENAARLNWNLWMPPVGSAPSRNFHLPDPGFTTGSTCDPMTALCDPFADAQDSNGIAHGPTARLLALQMTSAVTAAQLETFTGQLHLDEMGPALKAFTALQVDVGP